MKISAINMIITEMIIVMTIIITKPRKSNLFELVTVSI
jgi:hypothetical protein